MGADLVGYLMRGPAELDQVFREQFPLMDQDEDLEDQAATILGLDGKELLEDLFRVWRGDMGIRDRASRVFPEGFRVVFCGEDTWGDEPSGLGYTTLRDAFRFGLLEPFGVS